LQSTKKKTYRNEKLFFLFTGDENSFETMISNFVCKLKECTLKFSDSEFYFDAEYSGGNKIDKINPITKEIGLNLRIYCKRKDTIIETMNRITTKTINVSGNTETPAILEITPSIDIIDIVLTGLSDDLIIIRNLTGGKTVILNGEDSTVTVEGINKFTDTDMWEFPKLKPGSNVIIVNRSNVDINIKYKPRWI